MRVKMMKQRNHLEIRDAYDSEGEIIKEVTQAAYEEYAMLMPAAFWEVYWPHVRATLVEKGPRECIVAVNTTGIVGSVLLYPPLVNAYTGVAITAPMPEVRLLAVVPKARGQGVGTALMDECVRRARHMGATLLGLHTMEVMQAAVRMYERIGFVHTPSLDFRPTEEVLVKGYCRRLDDD